MWSTLENVIGGLAALLKSGVEGIPDTEVGIGADIGADIGAGADTAVGTAVGLDTEVGNVAVAAGIETAAAGIE